jgi:hypothetical protein
MTPELKKYAKEFARLGGSSKSEKKAAAARKNGLKPKLKKKS